MTSFDPEMAAPLAREMQAQGVDVRLGNSLLSLASLAPAAGLRATFANGAPADYHLVIFALGVQPETALAKNAGLALGGPDARGAVLVNKHMQTSDPAIYAVGDAVATADMLFPDRPAWTPLGGPANRQGADLEICTFGSAFSFPLSSSRCRSYFPRRQG